MRFPKNGVLQLFETLNVGLVLSLPQILLPAECWFCQKKLSLSSKYEDLLSDYYEVKVSYTASQLKMKILGDGKGYSLTEFCEEADGYVFVAEMWDKKPYTYQLLTSMTS